MASSKQLSKIRSSVGKQFELYDINERVTPQNFKEKVADNVRFVLRREKISAPGQSVIIPAGGYDWGNRMEGSPTVIFTGNWELFDNDHNTVLAVGSVVGWASESIGENGVLDSVDVTVTRIGND